MTHSSARRRTGRAGIVVSVIAAAAITSSCTASDPGPSPTATPTDTEGAGAMTDTSTIRSIVESAPESPTIAFGGEVAPLTDEQAVEITYPSGGLTVAGVVRTPAGAEDDAPVVVVVHGSVDPVDYTSGTDLEAEQRALLDTGHVVLAVDMRGYAGSDAADSDTNPVVDPGFGWDTVLDWGMALDVVNALRLANDGAIPGTDPDRVGLLGHSLGGLLAIDAAVIAPGLSQLVIAMSAPTTDFAGTAIVLGDESALLGEESDTVGATLPPADDTYWTDISPVTFFDRATEPLLLIHGGDDEVVPPESSEYTAEAWRDAGGEAEAIIVDGADHALSPGRTDVARTVVAAFETVWGTGGG